ncbi:hypothetical protein JZ751_018377, partial [Albula glossodonta]
HLSSLKQAQQGPVDGDTYNSLQMSTVSPSDYEVIRRREGSSQAEDQGTDDLSTQTQVNPSEGGGDRRELCEFELLCCSPLSHTPPNSDMDPQADRASDLWLWELSRTAAEISCSCESRGNPSPSMEWRCLDC